jgi:hypothetical protein
MRYDAARIDRAALGAARDALRRENTRRGGSDRFWAFHEGCLLSTSEQAADVLAGIGDAGPASWGEDLTLGRALLLGGHAADAVAPLQAAARSCDVLSTPSEGNTIWWMRSHVLLGQALEQTGDHAGACAAYAVVLDRWKNAKPRSVTLEEAKERSRALACSKP